MTLQEWRETSEKEMLKELEKYGIEFWDQDCGNDTYKYEDEYLENVLESIVKKYSRKVVAIHPSDATFTICLDIPGDFGIEGW